VSEKPSEANVRFLIGVLVGGCLTFIALAVVMAVKHEGSPVFFVALAASACAITGAVVASRARNKP
jgi:hypothetical protein